MKRTGIAKIPWLITILLMIIASCETESALERYYYQEGTFSGSIYEALDAKGSYNVFLEGIDSTELDNQLKNTLVTVIAPSDDAFEAFLVEKGYSSVSEMPIGELEDLISHHVITWPHPPGNFENEPVFFKRKSNMVSRPVSKYNVITQAPVTVMADPKYLQFYSAGMLNEYGATEEDYETLAGTDLSPETGFNIYDAHVDSIAPYGNGWVYYVDKVVEPRQNLDEWLLNAQEYSLFSDLLNRFSIFVETSGNNPPLKRSNILLNRHRYRIDMELCFEVVSDDNNSSSSTLKASSGFTVLAPRNEVLNAFIDSQFGEYPGFRELMYTFDKSSMDVLHVENILRTVITSSMFLDRMIFPSDLVSDAGVYNYEGTYYQLSESDIVDVAFCSNGYGYGINHFEVPRTFKSIMRPLFTTPDFTYMAEAIIYTDALSYLNDVNGNYTFLLPTNEAFNKQDIYMMDLNTYNNNYAEEEGIEGEDATLMEAVFLRIDSVNSDFEILEKQDLFSLIFNHLFTEQIDLTSGTQHAMNALGYYTAYNTDSIWSGGNMEERWIEEDDVITEGEPRIPAPQEAFVAPFVDNGKVHVIDNLIKEPERSLAEALAVNPEYSTFRNLCNNANLLSGDNLAIFGNYTTVFVPTNTVLDQFIAEGNLPTDAEELQNFVRYFFIEHDQFTTSAVDIVTETHSVDPVQSTEFNNVYRTIALNGTPGNLEVRGSANSSGIRVIEGKNSNIICSNGIIHQINGVLQY
jgi:uncharacterized surface protein with fasciclin (FAS1) repeats